MPARLVLALTFLFVLTACAALPEGFARGDSASQSDVMNVVPSSQSHEVHHDIHWSYDGDTGPEHWAELGDQTGGAYQLCASGQLQSPIDIVNASSGDLANIALHYQPSELIMKNNGHTVEVDYSAGGYIEIDQQRYSPVNIHYHAPSEHTIDGKSFDAELHLVHTRDLGDHQKEYAVIGILLTVGAENQHYQALLDNLPQKAGEEFRSQEKLDAAALLPSTATSYRYTGSLTTPPCSEGVRWNVMTDSVEISTEQLAQLTELFDHNHRPIQELYGREVIEDATP